MNPPGGSAATAPSARFSDPFGEGRVRQLIAENTRLERTLRELDLGIEAHSLVAVTDRNGTILEANDRFAELSKYPRRELIGASQRMLDSGRHSQEFMTEMSHTIARGEIWQGTLCNRAKDGTEFWAATTIVPLLDAHHRVEKYLYVCTNLTQLHLAEQRVRDLAYSDPLTGLPNRARMLAHLTTQARGESDQLRLYVTAELDNLGTVNDTYGFAVADHLLLKIAARLDELGYTAESPAAHSPLDRRPDLIARIGAAVFAGEFSGFDADPHVSATRMSTLAEQFGTVLLTVMREELGSAIEPRVRVSLVDYRPAGELDGADVFTRAEAARRHGVVPLRGGPVIASQFDQSSMEEAARRADLVLDLRSGIAAERLQLFLQPVVGVDRALRGFEGLVRWVDPLRGVVLPAEFIELAERTAMIVEIGDWVLDEACRILAAWAKDPATRDFTLSVNVSERQLRPDTLVNSLKAALKRHGARADRLKLEVTESMLHVDLPRSIEVLHALHAEGVLISLDDFGTGYSSLKSLGSLPVQQLKIDRSFVVSMEQRSTEATIVEAIVNLAQRLDMEVVAEGIETEEQFERLSSYQIDAFQGFLFGKPEPLEI